MSDLDIKVGSALDLGTPVGISEKSADKNSLPRLVIGKTGKLGVEKEPGKSVRLKGTNANMPWILGRAKNNPIWKETWKHEAIQARRQGYNIIRAGFDGFESVPHQESLINEDLLDKADYFIGTMGNNGVYTYLVSGIYLPNPWGLLQEGQRRDYTLRMYLGDTEVRKAWKHGAETLMNHVNAYTGLAWKDDPRIACIELFNEQEWGFFHPKSKRATQTQRELDEKFRKWLEVKYQTPAVISKAWGDPSITDFSQAITPEHFPTDSTSAKDNDFVLFCKELSHESARWMGETLRATGYKGLVAQYNISHWLAGQEARWGESQISIANTYHSHPSAFDSPDSKCNPESSVANAGWYWRGIAAMRFADRPFIETEYNHAFWNSYQHEGGLLFGAYSALQGLDGLIVHEGAIFNYVGKPGLGIFTVGKSPTLRANQFLLNCLWFRGDVKASPHRVELQIPKNYLEAKGNGGRAVSSEQNKLALLTGFSVAFPWAKPAEGVGTPATAPDWILPPSGSAEFQSAGGGWAIGEGKSSAASSFSLDDAVSYLKSTGIFSQENCSNPSKGIFQSDTGEITMRTRENLLKVATSRSEAVTLEEGKGEKVGLLHVVKTSVSALVATCAIDKRKLANSKRIVLIYATDTANTGMELSPDRTTLIRLGGLPILMKAGKLEMTLQNSNSSKMSLYALGLDGSRREKLPVKVHQDTLSIVIDAGALEKGITPFFELVAE